MDQQNSIKRIIQRAEQRKGGAQALASLMPQLLSNEALAELGDDRILAAMTRVVNQAGFNWSVIDKKWPQFEEAYLGFNPQKLALLSPEQWEAYVSDTRVIRNWQRIKAVKDNVAWVLYQSEKSGGFARFLADWPASDQVGLLKVMKKEGARLGGMSAQWFLRFIGKDGFVLSQDVVTALQGAGLEIAATPTSQRDLKAIQAQFNQWHEQTELPYAYLSRILACSVGENY